MEYPNPVAGLHHKLSQYIIHMESALITFYKGYLDTRFDTHIFDVFDNFFNDEDNFEYIVFEESEKTTFRYNARALSRTLYGTPVFWQLLLHVNEVDNEGDFELNGPVKVPIAHKFHTYVSQVYSLRRNELGDSFKYM